MIRQASDILERITRGIIQVIWPQHAAQMTIPAWAHWVYAVICMAVMIGFISAMAFFLIWLERKIAGRVQRRMGPMVTGIPRKWSGVITYLVKHPGLGTWLGGWLQTPMDAVKLFQKEDLIPEKADRVTFIAAPFLVMTACFMTFVIIPFGPGLIVRDLNIGILYFMAISSLAVVAIVMGGWGSNNKYSLLGGLRSAAQLISYEVPMVFSILSAVLLAGSIRMGDIVAAQQKAFFTGWFICPLFIGFVVYIIAAIAETNRPPFDIPEAESELVSGFNIEYSGMRFAMFYLAEFTNMFLVSAIATTLFLGGWTLPFGLGAALRDYLVSLQVPHIGILAVIGGLIVFFVKTAALVFFIMWTRWTFPRLRADQLMAFCWKLLVPLSLLNLLIASLWAMKFI
ncbi:MAG: NADH-quinone oxidoreductase subunit NuoH [Candidatus Eremiobacteraeota bacterium]|nr:NADH-quinone oxidoreductase subunit NuoH [Candidatus Eremiobacteraeota bacterium]